MKRLFQLFIALLLSYHLTLFLATPVFADEAGAPWFLGGGYSAAIQEGVTGSNAETFTTFQALGALPCAWILGLAGIPCDNPGGLSQNPTFWAQMQQRSVLGGVSRGIAMIYANPPADFGYWLADAGQNLGLTKPAYAQGIGFSGLAPLLPVWKAFRNIAYLILAVVMIVIGFMVMLRKKIDPKTVVTVQNALPRIIITLILITFSYAIVGFLIDLMYLLILLVVTVVGQSIQGVNIPELQAAFTAGGFWQLGKTFGSLAPLVGTSIPTGFGLLGFIFGIPGGIIGILAGMLVGAGIGGVTGTGATVGFFSPILILLLSLALIITLVRIFFILLNAYIQIIVSLLFGPLQIMMDAIPGGNGFASWLNHLIVNLLTFPIIATLVLLGMSINSNIESNFWVPPLMSHVPDSSTFIRALLGFGIIMTIPSIVNGIKEALKIKPAFPVTAGSLTQPLGSAWGVATQGLSQLYYINYLTQPGGALHKIASRIPGFRSDK